MELQLAGQAVPGRKRKIRLLFGLFIGLLIGFTLFSNTLMSLTLPKVVLVTPNRGELNHTFQGSGIVKWRVQTALSGEPGMRVNKVNVKEGEPVKKGLVLIVYDQKAAKNQILDEQAALSKLQLLNKELEQSYVEASQSGDEKSVESAKHALKVNEIDRDMQQRRIQKLQENLAETSTLVAPFDGIVTKVGAVEGLASSEGGPAVMIANTSLGFEFELLVPEAAAAPLEKGAKLDVQLSGTQARQIEGSLVEIQDTDALSPAGEGGSTASHTAMKKLLVAIKDNQLQGGERAEVMLTQKTDDVILVPNKAIHDEGDKKYVFAMEERSGPLGNAFYVRKAYITVVDSNDTQSAVTDGLFEQQSIVFESRDPLQDGDKVRVH